MDESRIRREYATLTAKTPYLLKYGVQAPGHAILLLFRFRLDSGEELDFKIDERLAKDMYESIRVGDRDLLTILDGKCFVDFGGKFGEPMEDAEPVL